MTDVVSLRIKVENFLQIMEDRFAVTYELLQHFTRMTADVEEKLAIAPGSDTCVACVEAATDKTFDLVQRLSRARQVPLFETTNLTMLTELLREITESYVAKGQWLFKPGQEPDTLYLIFEGAVRIEDPSGKRVAYAGPRQVVALGDFLRNQPHSFGAVTETPVQLLRIDKHHYIDVLEDHFDHALDLLAQLAARYLDLSGQLHEREGV